MPTPYLTTLPNEPWRRLPENPFVIVDRTGADVAAVEPVSGPDPVSAHARMSTVAQAIAALPDVLDAARLAITAIDALYPDWSDDDITADNPVGETVVAARIALRGALRRLDGLMPDGSIPPSGYLP